MNNTIELISSDKAKVYGCLIELGDWKTVIANKRACARLMRSLKEFSEAEDYSKVVVLDSFREKTGDKLSYYLTLAYIENDKDACHVEAYPVFAQAELDAQNKVEEVKFVKDDCEITDCYFSREMLIEKVTAFVNSAAQKVSTTELVK